LVPLIAAKVVLPDFKFMPWSSFIVVVVELICCLCGSVFIDGVHDCPKSYTRHCFGGCEFKVMESFDLAMCKHFFKNKIWVCPKPKTIDVISSLSFKAGLFTKNTSNFLMIGLGC